MLHPDQASAKSPRRRLAPGDATSFSRRPPPPTTAVYDSLWRFAAERQEIFFRRLADNPAPWTADPILQAHKFTNAYRASDRVSQYLIRNVIYAGDQKSDEVFLRTLLFKLFNRISTWEYLAERRWPSLGTFTVDDYSRLLDEAQRAGPIYSAAYVMPPVERGAPKHRGHLALLQKMLSDGVPAALASSESLADAFRLLRAYRSMGDFLAFQLVIDLNYGPLLNFREMDFVVPGPGAREGIRKCFTDISCWTEADLIRWATERQDVEFEARGIVFRRLWGRPLQLIDMQNLFCEIAKYARVAHPQFTPANGRRRIKQRFAPSAKPQKPWYPPKWGLNDKISRAHSG